MRHCFLLILYDIIWKKLHDKTIINSFQDSRIHQSMSHSIPLIAFDFDHTLLGNNFIDYHCSSLFVIDDKKRSNIMHLS